MTTPPELPKFLYLVRFDAEPPADAFEGSDKVTGAFLVCCIRTESFFQAIELATAAIDDEGWIHGEPEYAERCDLDDLLEDEDVADLVQAALTEGIAVACYGYEGEED